MAARVLCVCVRATRVGAFFALAGERERERERAREKKEKKADDLHKLIRAGSR